MSLSRCASQCAQRKATETGWIWESRSVQTPDRGRLCGIDCERSRISEKNGKSLKELKNKSRKQLPLLPLIIAAGALLTSGSEASTHFPTLYRVIIRKYLMRVAYVHLDERSSQSFYQRALSHLHSAGSDCCRWDVHVFFAFIFLVRNTSHLCSRITILFILLFFAALWVLPGVRSPILPYCFAVCPSAAFCPENACKCLHKYI